MALWSRVGAVDPFNHHCIDSSCRSPGQPIKLSASEPVELYDMDYLFGRDI